MDRRPVWFSLVGYATAILISLGTGALLYRWYGERRALVWSPGQLEISYNDVDQRLALLYDGRRLTRIVIGAVDIRSTGNRPVRWGDLDATVGLRLAPPRGAEMLRCSMAAGTDPATGARVIRSGPSGASLEFRSLRPGETMRVEYAHTGGRLDFPDLRCRDLECSVTLEQAATEMLHSILVIVAAVSLVFWMGLFSLVVTRKGVPLAIYSLGLCGLVVSLLFTAWLVKAQGGRMGAVVMPGLQRPQLTSLIATVIIELVAPPALFLVLRVLILRWLRTRTPEQLRALAGRANPPAGPDKPA